MKENKQNGRLLFIDKNPYGILIDTYKYCQYLQDDYDITYVCIDYGYLKVDSEKVKVRYVPYTNSKSLRGVCFFLMSLYYASLFKGFIFVSYFPGCEVLKLLLPWKKMHVDIRTLSVSSDSSIRKKWDSELNKAILKFDSISFITEGVKNKLSIPPNKKAYIIPLGSDVISTTIKDFKSLNLLYVGTLNNRRIIDTVIGFRNFIMNHPDFDANYTIVGDGKELSDIKKYILDNKIDSKIKLLGRLPYKELKPYFDNCNVGVSYVPITDYYQSQPPTKTFEYIMSGLYCLATDTSENRKIVNSQNGYLHKDNADCFCLALEYIYLIRDNINSNIIRKSLLDYSWGEIINNNLLQVINGYFHPQDD